MIDKEIFQLTKELHKELSGDDVPHIICVERLEDESAHFTCCCGAFNDVIKMIGAIINGYSKDSGIPQEDIFSYLAVALGGKEKKKMIYQNNEQYEKDKTRLINILIGGGVEDFAVNMLKQSKWIGCQDDNSGRCSLLKDVPTKMTAN